MFRLTKNEQRVVVLVMLALLTVAYGRYWRDVHRPSVPKPAQGVPEATPLPSAHHRLELEEADEAHANEQRPLPSPQSSP